MILTRNALIALALSAAVPAVPALAPVAAALPAIETVYRVGAGVRELVLRSGTADIPPELRKRNWTGGIFRQGSCVHASMMTLFRWQGRDDLAAKWGQSFSGGETMIGLQQKLNQSGEKFAFTDKGDESFLEWAARTRRGAGIVVQRGAHMIDLVGLTPTEALVIDPNSPETVQHRDRAALITEWREAGGFALTPLVGAPLPPKPWIVKTVPTKGPTP